MRSRFESERGAELVEMALVVLLFFTLVLGVFEFGRAYNIYQNITNAAREGARFAVAPARGGTVNYPNLTTEVRPVVEGFMRSSNLDPAIGTITVVGNQNVDPATPCTPCALSGACPCGTRVNISYPFSMLFFGNINLSTSVTMRNES